METGATSLGGGGVGGVGLATTVLVQFYGRFLTQTLARCASVTDPKLYVISDLRTTLAGALAMPEPADSMNIFYIIETTYYMSL